MLRERSDLKQEQLDRTSQLMNAHVRDALVNNFEDLIPSLILPDPDDRHVLAAAIRISADLILTFNIKDFPAESLAPYGIEACRPDPFLVDQPDLDPQTVCLAARLHRASLRNPPKSVWTISRRLTSKGFQAFPLVWNAFLR